MWYTLFPTPIMVLIELGNQTTPSLSAVVDVPSFFLSFSMRDEDFSERLNVLYGLH